MVRSLSASLERIAQRLGRNRWWRLFARAGGDFMDDNVPTLSAALTFATLLSFAPLLLLVLRIAAAFGYSAQEAIINEIAELAGDSARDAAQAVLDSAATPGVLGAGSQAIGMVVAIVTATSVFAQLQTSLNEIWHVEPVRSNAVWTWLRHRILSIGMLPALGFVMAVSLLISATLGRVFGINGVLWAVVDQLVSLLVFTTLFAALFRFLPDARLAWRHAAGGGAVTALLFVAGKALIALYLAHGSVGSSYGAAGSLVVLLVWVYYASAIFFFGAELVKSWCVMHGRAPGEAIAAARR